MKTLIICLFMCSLNVKCDTNNIVQEVKESTPKIVTFMLFENRESNCVVSVYLSSKRFVIILPGAPETFFADKVKEVPEEVFYKRGVQLADYKERRMDKNPDLFTFDDWKQNNKERIKSEANLKEIQEQKARAQEPYHHRFIVNARFTGEMQGGIPVWELVKK